MPRQQDIDQFKLDLAALAHEAEVLARWGEKPEIAQKPSATIAPAVEEGMPPDFAQLLDDLPIESDRSGAAPASKTERSDEFPRPSESAAEDFGELESIPEEEAAPEAFSGITAPPQAPESGAAAPEEDFSFDVASFVEPEGGSPAAEGPGVESFEFEEPAPGPAAAEESPPSPLDFETAGADETSRQTPIDESETMAFEELGDFNLNAGDETGGQMTAFEEPAARRAESGGGFQDFSIPDFGTEPAAEPGAPVPEPAAPEESAAAAQDAFDSFSFEESTGAAAFELPNIGSSSLDIDEEIASLGEEAPPADTFKLDQEWGGFALPGQAPPRPEAPRPQRIPRETAKAEAAEEYKPISLSESEVDALQDSLLSYPLNLRVAIEDILANGKGTEAQRSNLVWAMVDGASPADAAAIAGKILKRIIEIPKGYQKRTGAAFEAKKGTLAYAFVKTFLPALRIGFLVMAAAGLVGYLGWKLIYIPLSANSLYRTGYERIAEERYLEAEESFSKAVKTKEYIIWYYRYAEAYAAKRQYILAERKYASLIERHPREAEGILAWARLEREQMKYEEAVKVLKGAPRRSGDESTRGMTGLLSWDYFNKDGLLLLGDIYLDWADEDPSKYAEARRAYATLIEHYGDKPVFLERMLLYFIRTDKYEEVRPLKQSLVSDVKTTPLGASTLAELGGYLLDKGMLEDIRPILLKSVQKDPALAEGYYQLSRYYRGADIPDEERKALDKAVRTFAAMRALTPRQAGMYIDSLIWRGRLLLASDEWLSAELDFAAAAAEYEKGLELRRLKRRARFGEAYAGLGEVAFWQRDDLDVALGYYERAEKNGYSTSTTYYRKANILYRKKRYAESLEQFYQSMRNGEDSPYTLFAFGCALYARGDFFAAEAQFRTLAERMEKALSNIDQPMPQERASEIEVFRLGLKAQNNLGVAIYRTASRAGDARRRADAMAALARSIKLYDSLSMAPYAIETPPTRNLGLINMNKMLGAARGEELEIFAEIEKDPKYPQQ
jgi:tetratricopeptide (TPR) repeat protein